MFSSSLDVPALKEDGALNSVSSEDFKGRIDPRLRSIEMQEETGPVTTDANLSSKSGSSSSNTTSEETSVDLPNTETNMDENVGSADFEDFDQIPYDNKAKNKSGSEPNPFQPKTPQTKPVVKSPSTTPAEPSKPKGNLNLRDKIDVEKEPVQMNKVTVDGFSSPGEAKRVSQELMNSNLNVTPFIKETNGSYSLQVGSFSNPQKAESLANELKRRNLSVKVNQE